jgi:hypothetical protein
MAGPEAEGTGGRGLKSGRPAPGPRRATGPWRKPRFGAKMEPRSPQPARE